MGDHYLPAGAVRALAFAVLEKDSAKGRPRMEKERGGGGVDYFHLWGEVSSGALLVFSMTMGC